MRLFHELKYVTEFSHNSVAAEEYMSTSLVRAGLEELTLRRFSAINCRFPLTEKVLLLPTGSIIARY
jgi:hypothetical protein